MVNGERFDCLFIDVVVLRNKRRFSSGSIEIKRDGEVVDRVAFFE